LNRSPQSATAQQNCKKGEGVKTFPFLGSINRCKAVILTWFLPPLFSPFPFQVLELRPSQAQQQEPLVPAQALLALAAVEAELVLPFYHIRQTLK
jgi:hypothetical protein